MKIVEKVSSRLDGSSIRAFEAYMGVKEEYLETSLNSIINIYGTLDDYFANEFGLTKEKRMKLQDFYLE